ncbi:MAG: hypothetical protein IPJ89_02635 [Candidatus Iainarchaeum archaeon]|uniref:Type II toxin-antitoxin system RelE/ParE family toxin n=1 Tax=Candidatus Iainarchaeum sp. TaxID=3101447 RepID=A0A7T9I2J5_9ARCH|nr:MAG: hypothetical protein IPJ89_02635 [Candidatus Diapherotrites archaeon]
MQGYRIFRTASFELDFQKMDSFHQTRVEQFMHQLNESALAVGKPLGFTWFREKKFNGSRMYYLVYEEWKAVLAVGFSDKKDQPKIITAIRINLHVYRQYMHGLLFGE